MTLQNWIIITSLDLPLSQKVINGSLQCVLVSQDKHPNTDINKKSRTTYHDNVRPLQTTNLILTYFISLLKVFLDVCFAFSYILCIFSGYYRLGFKVIAR